MTDEEKDFEAWVRWRYEGGPYPIEDDPPPDEDTMDRRFMAHTQELTHG